MVNFQSGQTLLCADSHMLAVACSSAPAHAGLEMELQSGGATVTQRQPVAPR